MRRVKKPILDRVARCAFNADRLKRVRRALGLSVSQMAARLGVSPSTVRNWEKAIRIMPVSIARALRDLDDEPCG